MSNFNVRMRLGIFVALLVSMASAQTQNDDSATAHWQSIDQLCGQIQLEAPKKRDLVVNGKRETRLYTDYVRNAVLTIYPDECCVPIPLATVRSGKFGDFRFEGIRHGKYWLRVETNRTSFLVPLAVIHDFDRKSCQDTSVARDVIVDAKPPRVETRIR